MFKQSPHNIFNYQPLYYDKKKEKRDELKKKASDSASKIEGSFKSRIGHTADKKKSSNIRILVILGFIGLIAYYLLIHKDLISYMLQYLIPEAK
ncbi:MAG: hypothetical protein U9N85_00865 [Bacteroidota bacterium]|nr:hypothetical protein [Bacteroidota bacterium]